MTVKNNNPNDSIWNLRARDYQRPVADGCAHLLCGVVTCDVRAVRLCAGCAGGGHRGGEGAVELAGDIALDAAADLVVAFAIGTATGDVGLGGGVGADPRVGDDVDR